MRDLHDETEVQRLLVLCANGNQTELEALLHPEFRAFGFEDGLFICADRSTYMSFMARALRGGRSNARVEWIDVRSRLASGCILQEDSQARRIIVLTLLGDDAGWRVMTATLCAEDVAATDAPPRRLQ